ncbi:chromophore lyase CpcT/CpeT [Rubidibacter lacunae]|nr:chromophore lyase CpcT/CpeT [Rubidibacter lacunae]
MSDPIQLAQWMAGDFSNYKQSYEYPTLFAHIRIFFRPLPFEFFNTIGFYSEQVYDYDLWSPYRQGVHRLIPRGNEVYIENYALDDPMLYAGAARDLEILSTISPNCLKRRYNCSMVFRRRGGESFVGSVEPGNNCIVPRNGRKTYLVSEVEVTERTWTSRDRGFDLDTHEQVWGSAAGALEFEKRDSFASEVPIVF